MSSPGLMPPVITSRPPYHSSASEVVKAMKPMLGPKNEDMMIRRFAVLKLSSTACEKRSTSSFSRRNVFFKHRR